MQRQVQPRVMPRKWERYIPNGDNSTIRTDCNRKFNFKHAHELALGIQPGDRVIVEDLGTIISIRVSDAGKRAICGHSLDRRDGTRRCLLTAPKFIEPKTGYRCYVNEADREMIIYKEAEYQ